MLKTYVKVTDRWYLKITKKNLHEKPQKNDNFMDKYYREIAVDNINEDDAIYINRFGGFSLSHQVEVNILQEIQAEDFPEREEEK